MVDSIILISKKQFSILIQALSIFNYIPSVQPIYHGSINWNQISEDIFGVSFHI